MGGAGRTQGSKVFKPCEKELSFLKLLLVCGLQLAPVEAGALIAPVHTMSLALPQERRNPDRRFRTALNFLRRRNHNRA